MLASVYTQPPFRAGAHPAPNASRHTHPVPIASRHTHPAPISSRHTHPSNASLRGNAYQRLTTALTRARCSHFFQTFSCTAKPGQLREHVDNRHAGSDAATVFPELAEMVAKVEAAERKALVADQRREQKRKSAAAAAKKSAPRSDAGGLGHLDAMVKKKKKKKKKKR